MAANAVAIVSVASSLGVPNVILQERIRNGSNTLRRRYGVFFCQRDQLVDLLVFQRSAINGRLISQRCEPDPDVIVIPFFVLCL